MKTHSGGFMKKKAVILLCILSVTILIYLVTGCSRTGSVSKTSQSGFYFDTVITLTVYGDVDDAVFTEAFALCDDYEHKYSRTQEGSDIWNINHADGASVSVDRETYALIEKALYYAALSDGLIDPTIAPVKDLWDYTADTPVLPDPDLLSDACSHVDYTKVILDPQTQTVTLTDPDAALDLGFIAKGYIADRLKVFFLEHGISSALINLGGNVLCVGPKPDGSAYYIGIQYPFRSSSELITSVSCTDLSVVTSGIYERYFTLNDTIYHHILSPETGYPIENELLSVTILSESSTDGDALSTLCYCLGLDKGMALIESLDNTEAIFITDDDSLHYSSGAEQYITKR